LNTVVPQGAQQAQVHCQALINPGHSRKGR